MLLARMPGVKQIAAAQLRVATPTYVGIASRVPMHIGTALVCFFFCIFFILSPFPKQQQKKKKKKKKHAGKMPAGREGKMPSPRTGALAESPRWDTIGTQRPGFPVKRNKSTDP